MKKIYVVCYYDYTSDYTHLKRAFFIESEAISFMEKKKSENSKDADCFFVEEVDLQ